MKSKVLILSGILLLVSVMMGHAQTVDYHIGIGMKSSKSTPPEVIDMKWARQYMDANATLDTNATQRD